MEFSTIKAESVHNVLTITLNRPKSLNAFNSKMIKETTSAFKQAAKDNDVRSVVITGSGRAFSSGQDLKEVSDRQDDFSIGQHLRQGYNKLILAMISLEKPIIAAVNGVAAGAGCSVALAADIRIASENASFIQVFSRIGLIPDSGSTWLLPRLIGYARAYEMAITSDRITAEKAISWGLVNQVTPAVQLMEIVEDWAKTLSTGPTLAYGLTKRAMVRGYSQSLVQSLEYESQLQELASRSEDFNEGVQAFFKKRDPVFQGK